MPTNFDEWIGKILSIFFNDDWKMYTSMYFLGISLVLPSRFFSPFRLSRCKNEQTSDPTNKIPLFSKGMTNSQKEIEVPCKNIMFLFVDNVYYFFYFYYVIFIQLMYNLRKWFNFFFIQVHHLSVYIILFFLSNHINYLNHGFF